MTLILLLVMLLILTSCAPQVQSQSTSEAPPAYVPPVTTKVPDFLPGGSDDWREYSFDPATIKKWTDPEQNEIIDVWVRIDYKNNPGTAVRDEQQWHLDYANKRYKVSDSYAYDADGNFCET